MDVHQITLAPIGFVRNGVTDTPRKPHWQIETISDLVIAPQWAEGLDGLEGFSHLIVLFWFHKVVEQVTLRVHPMHREDLAETGMFATRTPNRPNRIGETVVRLIERRTNILRVRGLDALDGSPILDIKPYLRSGDLVQDAAEPPWAKEGDR